MLKNTNKAAVEKLGTRALKQNKTRNRFVILAIILTTLMFTTVFTIGFSLAKNLGIMMLRQQGTKASITLEQPADKQLEQAKKADNLYAAGIRIPVGVVTDTAGEADIRLDYYDKTEFEKNVTPAIHDIEGSYPDKEKEIMLSKAALDGLHIKNPKAGMDIVLDTVSGSTAFRLTGWYTDYGFSKGGFQALVSKAYAESMGKTQEKDGVMTLSAKTGKKEALLEELKSKVSLKSGQEFASAGDVQEKDGGNKLVIACVVGIVGLIIVVSGYLLIYNIMYISVSRDIRFYGMLKTIGTSPSQIKKIVKMQIFRLSMLGVPVGILVGTILSFAAVPIASVMFDMGMEGIMPSDISFHPFIYLGTVLFVLITVILSCRKPAKLASRVSPVEALKYNGQSRIKTKEKRTTDGGRLYRMSFRNVFREKKRALLVFASLFMGTMAFLSVDTFLGCMKLDNYIARYLPNDFAIHTYGGWEQNTEKEKENYLFHAKKLAKELRETDGVTQVGVNRSADLKLDFDESVFMPFLEEGFADEKSRQEAIRFYREHADDEEKAYSAPVIAVSSEMMKKYNERARQKMDIERFEKGEICLMMSVSTEKGSEAVIGKTITLRNSENQKFFSMEVGACPTHTEDYGLNIGSFWQKGGAPSSILISETALNKVCDTAAIDTILVDCDARAESRVKAKIKELVKVNPCVAATEFKSDLTSEFVSSMMAMNILGGGISLVLILIGIINFINVMVTGVFARRRELAVMESVGMTKKQVKRMLVFEGSYYGGISLALLFTVGNAMTYLIAHMACQIADYAVFHYPIGLMCMITVVIMAVCTCVPVLVYRSLSKESVTERLRIEE